MAIDILTTCKVAITVNWQVGSSREGLAPVQNVENIKRTLSFDLQDPDGDPAADSVDQIISLILDIPPQGVHTIDLTAALTNVVKDLAVTLARVHVFYVELLNSSAIDANTGEVIGNNCSALLIGGDQTASPWLFLEAGDCQAKIGNGDILLKTRRDETGMQTGGAFGQNLIFHNLDPLVNAKVLVVLEGSTV